MFAYITAQPEGHVGKAPLLHAIDTCATAGHPENAKRVIPSKHPDKPVCQKCGWRLE